MSVKAKYQGVLNLGEQLGIKGGDVTEEGGVLPLLIVQFTTDTL